MTVLTERLKFLGELQVMYSASFVPFSQSRNKKAGHKVTDRSLNWRCNLSRGANKLSVEYTQGIAWCPSYVQHCLTRTMTAHEQDAILFETENGRHYERKKAIEIPPLEDVLSGLLLDYSVLDYATFEEWASESGYDHDSRWAEKVYKECIATALQLRTVLGDANIEKLRELFHDY